MDNSTINAASASTAGMTWTCSAVTLLIVGMARVGVESKRGRPAPGDSGGRASWGRGIGYLPWYGSGLSDPLQIGSNSVTFL